MITFGLVVTLATAVVGWWVLFRVERPGMWPRTWMVASTLGVEAVIVLALDHRLDSVLGPHAARQVLAGVAVGAAWLVANHVGHDLIGRLLPSFLRQVSELYRLQVGDRPSTVVGPIIAMGVAEELVFRGVIQGWVGLVGAVAAYTAVQLVTGNLALTIAGAACGVVWGTLAWWQGGLVAPIVAHLIWTTTLTFAWPLPVAPAVPRARVGAST